MSETIAALESLFPEFIIASHSEYGDDTLIIKKEGLLNVGKTLHENPVLSFDFLMDLTGVDYLGEPSIERFEVVYHLYSLKHNHRIRLRVPVPEKDCTVETLTGIWGAANWMEREVFDMYGIIFSGHPDLRRILMYEEFSGHPLRKDYPITRRQPLVGPKIT